MHTTLIAARDEDGAIGRHSGGLPWHLPDETAHFRAYCQHQWLIVGRHTFNEMLGWFQPGHHIIVLTRNHHPLPALPNPDIHVESARRMEDAQTRALQSGAAELVVIGYNSASYDPNGGETETLASRTEHSQLAARANAYMNATWAITIAKAGDEDGSGLIGGSCIVDPNGHIVAEAKTLGDELIIADVDLNACQQGKEKMFNFAAHRRPNWYGPITSQVGAMPPD